MPLPFALDHINLWMIEDGEGYTIVDTGIGLDSVKALWEKILGELCGDRPVRRLIVTHFHPDHLGLGQWLKARLGGMPVWATHGEYVTAHAVREQLPGFSIPSMLAFFKRHGLDQERLDALDARGNGYRRVVPELPSTYRRIFDGEEIAIGAHRWRVMVGYGHSPEHAALYCAQLGIMISGDMVLPRISTNISVYAATPDADPITQFVTSLARYAELPADTLVLPSHGRPFFGLRERVAQLTAHHEDRCNELLAHCRSDAGPKSAGDLLQTLFPRELDTHQVMFAMGEAVAHLNHLEQRGRLRCIEGEDHVLRFVPVH
jgi:glyoxylase-like metal-dependent hydrolase (beta-lactamase superfamily II)